MSKAELMRLERVIREGEMDDCWVTLKNGDVFFSNKTIVTRIGAERNVTFYTENGVVTAAVSDIVTAVH